MELMELVVMEQPFHKLVVWQKADEFAREVYLGTIDFPMEEKFGITSQLRRAALSVPVNIVEGQARGSSKDFVRFLLIARGSLSESAYLLEFAHRQGFLTRERFDQLIYVCRHTNVLLDKFIKGIRNH